MITIIDYGLGNILSFVNVYKRLNINCSIAKQSDDLKGATKIILPGVGSFDHAMVSLSKSGMRPLLDELVLERKTPVLGICVGMQMLANSSDEGELAGLGWIEGKVRKFDIKKTIQLPHMGWNDVTPARADGLFFNLGEEARFYFLHSYYFECAKQANALAFSECGENFTCAVSAGNVYGVQFHPEKSHHYGVQLLKNFSDL